MTNRGVQDWLEEAGGAMGGDATGRRDALLELESAIYEKVEERTATGESEEQAVEIVLRDMGDPVSIGHAFVPQSPIIAPERTRSFYLYTCALFAVHFVLVISATMAGQPLTLGPLQIRPIADSTPWNLFARAAEVLVFDAGVMLVAFMFRSRLGRLVRLRVAEERAGTNKRRHFETAAFLALVLVVANFLRDNLLALYLLDGDGEGTLQVPLLGSGFTNNLILFNVWMLLAMAREVWFGFKGETRGAMLLDVVARSVGIFCLLRIVATRKLVDLTAAKHVLGTDADTVGSLLNSAFSLIALVTAALIAIALVKRLFRLFA
ncbi:MAG: permease prefix domain 1-containing protein [Planctomycetota bacterium]